MKMYLGVSVGFSAMVLVVGGCHSVYSLCLASLDRIEGFGHDSSSKDGESIQICILCNSGGSPLAQSNGAQADAMLHVCTVALASIGHASR